MDRHALSFGRLRGLADVLRIASSTGLHLRPFAVELFRVQTEFNHRVVDVLEDAVWTARRADHAAQVERRLCGWVEFRAEIPTRRKGLRGQVLRYAKRAGLKAMRTALAPALALRAAANRGLIERLKALGTPFPADEAIGRFLDGLKDKSWLGLQRWFIAQAEFYEEVERFIRELGDALLDPAAAFKRFGESQAIAVRTGFSAGSGESQITAVVIGEPSFACLDSLHGTRVGSEGDVVVRLPGDERLVPGALKTIGAVFAADPRVQLCYGDTFFDELGVAALKPGWSPEYLLSTNYIGGCFAMRGDLALRQGLNAGASALRWLLAEPLKESEVVRVPWVLSRRARPEEVDENRERRVVEDRLKGSGRVEQGEGFRRVRLTPEGTPRVTIIVPFKDKVELLRGLCSSLTRFDAGLPFDVVLVSNQSVQPETFAFLKAEPRDPRFSWFEWDEDFNWSAINNAAAASARSELLLFLNNDTAITHDGWLSDLAGYALHPEVGVAGARLLYEDRSIQHAGVVIGLRGLAGHAFARWRPEYGSTPFGSPEPTRNWSAVTGACLMIRRKLFEDLGGFDERIRVSGGDVELCLRVRARGLRVVCVGHVELLHYESMSRRSEPVPEEDFRREEIAYAELLKKGDPYYHPQLSAEVGHGSLGPLLETPAQVTRRSR